MTRNKSEYVKIIAANRFPVNPETKEFNLGGLATALGSDSGVRWVGASDISLLETINAGGVKCIPAIVDPHTYVGHYEGASNAVYWPAFHGLSTQRMLPEWWQSNLAANVAFANAISFELRQGINNEETALVWIHDYHLMFLPNMLRQRSMGHPIGFFLHIPFPSLAEMITLIESRVISLSHVCELVRGMLGSDLIGFHIDEYSQNFLQLVEYLELAEVEVSKRSLTVGGRSVKVAAFPIGIEPERYSKAVSWIAQNQDLKALRRNFDGGQQRKILVGVDRLDYTKGIDHRLLAFQKLLRSNRISVDEVVMVQVATPNRENIAAYIDHKAVVEQIVDEIHEEFGREVLYYVDQGMPLDQLATQAKLRGVARTFDPGEWPYSDSSVVELLAIADIALVTPSRDGMNLVAKEFVAVQQYCLDLGLRETPGALVLSDGAGVVDEIGDYALVHKANDIDDIADQIAKAMRFTNMNAEARLLNHEAMAKVVLLDNTVKDWRDDFWTALALS